MTPWLDDGDVRLYQGDALEVLRELPAGSVHACMTSPPFYGLRSYIADGHEDKPLEIGLEETPDEWVESLVAVFREVRRVLRDDGTLWVEIGDSYSGSGPSGASYQSATTLAREGKTRDGSFAVSKTLGERGLTYADKKPIPAPGTKAKDLIGQPWLLAFALRADGWYLRSEIIWARPNPMPESVTDRPTKSHSTVFLLSKRPRYYFDSDAIREPYKIDGRTVTTVTGGNGSEQHRDGERWPNPTGANARSVWLIPTEPTPFAHFATWPQALVRRMVLAGTSERGACPECGAPWVRETEREREYDHVTTAAGKSKDGPYAAQTGTGAGTHDIRHGVRVSSVTLGWSPSCDCACNDRGGSPYARSVAVPCTVLDPFAGSGTTSLVARNHGRHSIGIELNPAYLEIAAKRLQQLSLLTEGATP